MLSSPIDITVESVNGIYSTDIDGGFLNGTLEQWEAFQKLSFVADLSESTIE